MKFKNKLIIANWKANPQSLDEAISLAEASDVKGLVICPPFVFLKEVAGVLQKSKLGAQDFKKGLKKLGVEYVIIGHSDRRQNLDETNEMVAKKFSAAIGEGLIPILCVGETLEQKRSGQKEKVITEQIQSVFANCKLQIANFKFFIAYEPVWAIGTGEEADSQYVLDMIEFIKKIITERGNLVDKIHFLYGGSIDSSNAKDFLRHDVITGALVGGASLDTAEIKKITVIASEC
ncbi:MAG: triose-phosphate isomerase family protein [Patescibacteria group bacterium]